MWRWVAASIRMSTRAGPLDHRENRAAPLAAQYAPAHPVAIMPGGLLARAAGRRER